MTTSSTPLKKTALLATFGLALMGMQSAHAVSTNACQPVDAKTIEGLFDRWNDSLKTLDPKKVTANYAPTGVLLPTVANQPHATPAEIEGYFPKFLKNEPQGKIDKRFVKIGCDMAQDVGTYTFTMKGGQKVSARYTYVYEYINGQWLIVHHHSSAMPEVQASATP